MTKLPETLYHYTNQEGFLGIISSKKIWATDILFLNDAIEFEYSVNLLKNSIDLYLKSNKYPTSISLLSDNPEDARFFKLMSKPFSDAPKKKTGETIQNIKQEPASNKFEKRLATIGDFFTVPNRYNNPNHILTETLESFLEGVHYVNKYFIFVFSLSNKEDSLSQWRGYCQESNGFCLGFNTLKLKNIFSTSYPYFKFIKCIYDTKKQEAKMEEFVDGLIKNLKAKVHELGDRRKAESNVFEEYVLKFIEIAVQFKNKSFADEKEWRIVSPPLPRESVSIKYRIGRTMIIPYINISFSKQYESNPINKIIIGPTLHNVLSKRSVESLLSKNNIASCEIVNSTVPYRPL